MGAGLVTGLDWSSGGLRLSPSDFEALVGADRHRLADDRLDALLSVIVDPAAELRLVVAGPETRVEHRGWLAGDVLVLLLGVRAELRQLMSTDRAFLAATLVRLTRMRPRHLPERGPVEFAAARLDELVSTDPRLRALALAEAGADFAWRLDVSWAGGLSAGGGGSGGGGSGGGRRSLTAVDGDLGLRLADPDRDRLVPVTNTFAYRVLSTALAPA